MMPEFLAIIPARNAAATLPELLSSLKRQTPDSDILVVDDGSSDNTAELARAAGADCLRHGRNRGKGAALRTGFSSALERDYRAVLTIDADLQHDPTEVGRFLSAFAGKPALVIGVRERNSSMPLPRQLSNFLVSLFTSILAGRRLIDSQCGYRLIPTDLLRQLQLDCSHYELELELLIKAARLGFPIRELPVATVYNQSHSFIRPLGDTIRFLKMTGKSLFW